MKVIQQTSTPITWMSRPRLRRAGYAAWLVLCLQVALTATAGRESVTNAPAAHGRSFLYYHESNPDVPWSIHIVKVARNDPAYTFTTTLGSGDILGMGTVSDQLQSLPASLGRPLAAVNGDFYERSGSYPGRPRDLQIREGELLTEPAGHMVFWLDRAGSPHMTNIESRFRVEWPDGSSTPIGLNEERRSDTAVLYTHVTGASTRTRGGMELRLGRPLTNSAWMPLRIGVRLPARVLSVRAGGDSPLDADTLVLSIGPALIEHIPMVEAGATTLVLVTESVPDLAGARVAVGGGPALVQDGRTMEWTGLLQLRHPRTAIGWNKDYIILMEVDGRQINLSLGMSFPELAAYMLKLGCDQAMNLDGGGSATMWVLGSVMNSPSEGGERPGANALVVVKRERDD